jgi:hypothetical protein
MTRLRVGAKQLEQVLYGAIIAEEREKATKTGSD